MLNKLTKNKFKARFFSHYFRLQSLTDQGLTPGSRCENVFKSQLQNQYYSENDIFLIDQENKTFSCLYARNEQEKTILLTDRCNCSCIMCPQNISEKDEKLDEINELLINNFPSKDHIPVGVTGGEPTVRPDKLADVLRKIYLRNKKCQIHLLTNGIALSDFNLCKKIVDANPNIIFQISLHSDVETIHNKLSGIDCFSEVQKGIINLFKLNQKIEIRHLVNKVNFHRLKQFSDYIYRNLPFVYHVAFMGIELEGRAVNNKDQLWINPHEYKNDLEKAVRQLNTFLIHSSVYNLPLCVLSEYLWEFSEKSISSWKNIYSEKCDSCLARDNCTGLFRANYKIMNNVISPISDEG